MAFYDVAHFFTSIWYKLIYRVKVTGKENIPAEGGCIFCSNHTSNYDPIVVGALTTRRKTSIMAKKELFENRLLAPVISGMGAFPVDRDGGDISAVKTALKVLKRGEVLIMFPEGTRTKEIDLAKAKPGVSMISIKAKVPIVPIHIESSYKLCSELKVTIGEPFSFEEYYDKKLDTEDYARLSQEILKKIYDIE